MKATPTSAPSTKFTREEILTFAQAGVRQHVREMEREIVRLQAQFPEIMVEAAVALLKPEPRADGQTWPPLAAPEQKAARKSRRWTPTQRKAAAARMNKHRRKIQAARVRRQRGESGVAVWERMHAALLAAPDHRASSKELQDALGLADRKKGSVAIANSYGAHTDIFRRVGQGVYSLTAAGKKAAENGATA